jgi:hypothetical protein
VVGPYTGYTNGEEPPGPNIKKKGQFFVFVVGPYFASSVTAWHKFSKELGPGSSLGKTHYVKGRLRIDALV